MHPKDHAVTLTELMGGGNGAETGWIINELLKGHEY